MMPDYDFIADRILKPTNYCKMYFEYRHYFLCMISDVPQTTIRYLMHVSQVYISDLSDDVFVL